jgi:hypothetical protein
MPYPCPLYLPQRLKPSSPGAFFWILGINAVTILHLAVSITAIALYNLLLFMHTNHVWNNAEQIGVQFALTAALVDQCKIAWLRFGCYAQSGVNSLCLFQYGRFKAPDTDD